MSGSDSSPVANQIYYKPPDLIGQAGQIGQLQQLMLGNQVTRQQLTSKNAIGADFQSSIDPQTGQFNPTLFAQKVAADPSATYGAPEAYNQSQTTQGNQYQLNQAQLAQTTNRLAPYKAAFAPLLAKGDSVSPSDVYSTIRGLAAAGMPTDAIVGDVSSTMPVMDPAKANDPAYQAQYGAALHGWIQNQWGSNLPSETQAGVFRPNTSLVNTGGGIQGVDTNPTTNPGVVGSSLPVTLTPAQAVSPIQGTTSSGTPYFEPTSRFAQQTGNGNLVAGGAGAPSGGSASIFGHGRLPGRGALYNGPTAAAGSTSGAMPDVPPGTLQTGIGPAQTAGATVAGQGSASDLHNLYQSVSTSGARLYQLGQALKGLQALGPQGTGPNTDTYNYLKSWAQSLPVVGGLAPVDPNKIANYDEINKYLTQYASNTAANMGAGTDAKLAAAFTGNPSTHISNLAAVNVVKATMGLERMQQAQAQAFSQSGLPASSYDQWATNWNKTADARAYAFDLMTPQQRGAVLNSMKGTARTQFLNQVWTAAQAGFIDPGKLGFASGSGSAPASASPAAPAAPSGPPIDPSTGLPVGITP